MATKQAGFAHKKGAVAAARKVLGHDAVLDAEFEVFEIEGGRFDWKAVERKKAPRRTSGKGSPFANLNPMDALPLPGAAQPGEVGTEAPVEAPANELVDHSGAQDATPAPTAAATAFGAFAMGQLGNNGNDRRTEDKGGNRRASDKPAAEKKTRIAPVYANGVRQPSPGTVCRQVWDELDKIRDAQGGVAPDSKQVKALAESMKWNPNNASIEFYQWRKFNGITGRSKQAPAAKPVKE